jgi:putative transposase
MRKQKKQTFLSDILQQILAEISEILNLEDFKECIGRKDRYYLLAYVAGLILCRMNETMTGMAEFLKLCRHDSLQRLLSTMDLPGWILSGLFIRWIEAYRREPGYLMIDDTVLDKRYSKSIDCAAFAYSSNECRVIMGIHIVAMYWSDGKVKIPVGYRLWIPKEKAAVYRTKVELAFELLADNEKFCRTCKYLTFDAWYCTNKFLRLSSHLGLALASRLNKVRNVIFKGRKMKATDLRRGLHQVVLPGFGTVSVYCCKASYETRYYMSTDTSISGGEIKRRYDSRWRIEESFRFSKQHLGLESCQCRRNAAVQNHISLALLAHFVMEVMSIRMNVNVYGVSKTLVRRFLGITDEFPSLRKRRTFMKHAA